ncbi:MAG: type II secretory pathway component GspD/PulD (secretin) [Gammaproteobacteria bacterium]|jgi:type II secretory pathway component GspD/PulD (secretin)
MIRTLLSLLLLILILPVYAQQQMKMEVIPLKNNTPEHIIEVIRPLLVPGASISGMKNQLIIKSTPQNLYEIKNILSAIDKPLQRLKITVTQYLNVVSNDQDQTLSTRIRSGDVNLSNRASVQNKGIVISGSDGDGNIIDYRINDNRSNADNSSTYTVQTLEGEPAFIQSGLSVPISNPNTIITRNGVIVQKTVEYRDATSGFYVLPRINGNRLTLMVAPQITSVNPGQIPTFNIQNVQTTVTGQLGEWIEIGGLGQTSQENRQSILSGSASNAQETRTVLIKVEEIR